MPWTCPVCKREFRHANQWHSCARLSPEDHLRKASARVAAMYEKLLRDIRTLEGVNIDAVKAGIMVKAPATFLAVKVKKDRLEIEFQLGREAPIDVVYKSLRISKKRFLHRAVLEEPPDVSAELLRCLKESYEMIREQK